MLGATAEQGETMKISLLVLAGVLASATCLTLWLWSRSEDSHDLPATSVGSESVQSKPSSKDLSAPLERPSDPNPRESIESLAHSNAPTAAHEETKPTPAAPQPGTLLPAALAKASTEELASEAKRLRDQVADEARPILKSQLAKGQAEFLSTEQKYTSRKEDSSDICCISYVPGSGMYRVMLAREAYPELYAMQQQAGAIERVIHDRQVELYALNKGK
jgi:hypothetical protein